MTTQTSGIRPLTDTEIDDVNGGLAFIVAILGVVSLVSAIGSAYNFYSSGGPGSFEGNDGGGVVPGL